MHGASTPGLVARRSYPRHVRPLYWETDAERMMEPMTETTRAATTREPAPDARSATPPRRAAVAGLVAGALGLATSELVAGIISGAPSLAVAVGGVVIALQPPGAKQLMVDLFGEADKLVLNVAVVLVALAIAAVLGVVSARRFWMGALGFGAVAAAGAASALLDPLVEPAFAVLTAVASGGVTLVALARLLSLARPFQAPGAEMPDWERRRFLGTSLAVAGVAATGGVVGRILLAGQREITPPEVVSVPSPVNPLPSLPAGSQLSVPGLTPLVVPNDRFYRIDTSLLIPRLDARTWRLRVRGMVEREVELAYEELLALPLYQQYVTIACVSNEVGGRLVGNALWTGVRLRQVLDMAGVLPGATQIVGRAFDGWTAGFPTEWIRDRDREALIAVSMNGQPLPPRHGFPARLIVPGLYGYVSATKWLTEIELNRFEEFDAYWVPLGWAKEAPVKTQSRIDVPRRGEEVARGEVAVAGVAWAPDRGVSRVEVQVDDEGWQDADIATPISDATWVQWLFRWEANPGQHRLRVRATDGDGEVQTAEVSRPDPDGATGHHTIEVAVA